MQYAYRTRQNSKLIDKMPKQSQSKFSCYSDQQDFHIINKNCLCVSIFVQKLEKSSNKGIKLGQMFVTVRSGRDKFMNYILMLPVPCCGSQRVQRFKALTYWGNSDYSSRALANETTPQNHAKINLDIL